MKFRPVILAPLMGNRPFGWFILTAPVIFILLNITGLFVWQCPFHQYTGLDCAGCGMTRGILELIRGHMKKAITLHPFSPLLLFSWITWFVIFFLPEEKRNKALGFIQHAEEKTAFALILLILYLLFGLCRLCFEIV